LSKHVSIKIRKNGLITPLLPQSGSGGEVGKSDDTSLMEHNVDTGNDLDYYYGSNNGRYLGTEESIGLGEVESEVPEDVLPTVTLVPPAIATTSSLGNNSKIKNNKLPGLGDSQSNGSKKSPASEVELMISPPLSRQRSPVRGAQSGFPAPFDAPADNITRGGGAGDAAHSHPTRRSKTLGYDELVHMPAKEYRQRALADMAAAVSFYKGRGAGTSAAAEAVVTELEALDESEEEEEEEEEESGVIRDEERGEYTPPEIPPPPLETSDDTQQNLSSPVFESPPMSASMAPSGGQSASAPAALSLPQSIKFSGGQYGRTSPQGMILIEEGEEISKFDKRLATLNHTLESAATPVMFLLKSTIPIVEMTSYDKFWFLIAMGASPLFICIYLGALTSFSNLATAVLVGALSSSFCAFCTRNLDENEAPLWNFGTGYPLGAGLVALYGFAVAAMWIDIFASEIVGVLHFFGLLAGIHPAVLGVTVLAWGNSLTDFVANTSMAGRSAGGTSMAMTACFAGPLFNTLIGLGIGFWAYLADTKQKSTPIKFDSVVLVGCVFAMLNCAGVVATAVKNKHHLPGQVGWVMCGWYLLYMLVVLIMSAH